LLHCFAVDGSLWLHSVHYRGWASKLRSGRGESRDAKAPVSGVDVSLNWNTNTLGLICFFILIGITVWFLIELGMLKGTPGPNRFGPDPARRDADRCDDDHPLGGQILGELLLPDSRGVTRGIKFLPLIFWFFGGAQWALERVALLWPIAMALNHGAVAGVVLIAAGLYQWMPAGHHLDGPHSAGGVESQGVCTSRKALANQFPTQPILAQHHHARVHHSIPVAMLTSSS
jgi:hypothetical protein